MNAMQYQPSARRHAVVPRVLLGSLALSFVASQAVAGQTDVSLSAGVASDYVFRGVSQTDEKPQGFAGVSASAGDIYVGAWASNVDYGDSTDAEVDLYGGWQQEINGWAFDAGAIFYAYPGQPDRVDYDYAEAKLALSHNLGQLSLGTSVYYSPDFFGPIDEATYGEVNAAYGFASDWAVSAAYGHQGLSSSQDDYSTWNIGLSWDATDKLALDLRYHDTDAHDAGVLYEGRVVGALTASF